MATSKTSKHKVVQWPHDPKGGSSGKPKVEADKSSAGDKAAGRIEHDARGNAVWRRGSGDSTSTMLKKLEVPELKFEGQEEHKSTPLTPKASAPAAKPAAPPVDAGGGYNPYESTAPRKPTPPPKAPLGKKTK